MKAILSIQVTHGDQKGQAISSVSIPYEAGMDIRQPVGLALVQVIGVTLDKAIAMATGSGLHCQQ